MFLPQRAVVSIKLGIPKFLRQRLAGSERTIMLLVVIFSATQHQEYYDFCLSLPFS